MLKKSFSILKFNSTRLLSLRKPDDFDWTIPEQKVMEPMEYINKVPSKHHKLMPHAYNHWLKIPKDKFDEIEETLQTLHTASLLLDDIQDDSEFRYGVPAAHRVFGIGLTVNAVSNALVTVAKNVLQLGPSAAGILLDRVGAMHQGQGIDLYWREHFIIPTEEALIDMITKKNGSFFVLPVELLQLFSSNKKNYTKLANNIALYYTIVDDYYNLFDPEALQKLADIKQNTNNSCSDITESKITLPIIHAMQFPDVADEVADILKQRTSDPKLLNRFIELLRKHGSDEYMRDALRKLEADIRSEINEHGGNAILISFMDDLSFQKNEKRKDVYK